MRLELIVHDGMPGSTKRRLMYAARTFAATYGLAWGHGGIRLLYGLEPSNAGDVALNVAYRPMEDRNSYTVRGWPRTALDGETSDFPQIHWVPNQEPDWLGEVFTWISGEVEEHTDKRDPIGAIPFEGTVAGRYSLDPEVPWATVAMHHLAADIRATHPTFPEPPPSIVVATHDLDFLPLSATSTLRRILKNAVVALLIHRSPRLAASIVTRLRAFPSFEDVAHHERHLDIASSAFVIATHGHRRDANYRITDGRVVQLLHRLAVQGMEIGVHGSYESVLGTGSLKSEYATMRGLAFPIRGGRQHWLRYRHRELFRELVAAEAEYDSSVGFNDRPGFRAGASFAWAPYDFRNEQALPLLELPMVLMDAALFEVDRTDAAASARRAARILRRAQLYGGGTSSIIWHNTGFGGVQLPDHLGELYWQLKQPDVRWVSGATAVDELLPRFRSAGLLG